MESQSDSLKNRTVKERALLKRSRYRLRAHRWTGSRGAWLCSGTKDIDILILHDALSAARDALAPIGYDLDAGIFKFDQGTEKETQLFRVSRADGPTPTTLDLMMVRPILEEV